ncbi:MAG: hypothetical protein WKG07_00915 [Hymenobacter sp.]
MRWLPLPALGGLLIAGPGRPRPGRRPGRHHHAPRERPIKLAAPAGQAAVPPGYFLFPIAPGQPGFLAASMGELRPNHFHGGLDIKTGGGVNKPRVRGGRRLRLAPQAVGLRLRQRAVHHPPQRSDDRVRPPQQVWGRRRGRAAAPAVREADLRAGAVL